VQCQYPYADTPQHEAPTDRSPDDRRNRPHDPMTTPDDASTTETNRATNTRTTTDASPRRIPGRTPITEEAGAPLVPPVRTGETDRFTARPTTDTAAERFETPRREGPPTDAERDAPLVPDLRPTRRPRTDGGSR